MRNLPTIITIILAISGCVSAEAQDPWQQKADHKINVTLNPTDNSLDGHSRIRYTNNSPDTLRYIWFHLWPNAYRNDMTAFSDQLLENGDTRFYFSSREDKGYINRLDFRNEGQVLRTTDHPQHIDIVQVHLNEPLLPGTTVEITTPFHVQLPRNFSRGGHFRKTYQVTQWYPKPAVYDKNGWHPMPYLDQGEFYAEFGDYEVAISVPEKFTVAATGQAQTKIDDALFIPPPVRRVKKTPTPLKTAAPPPYDWSGAPMKTIVYKQENVHDFAWFADTTFSVQSDTVKLLSGKVVNLKVYFHLDKLELWGNAIAYMKDALRVMSYWVGDYPYNNATVVDGYQGFSGGMEYPTITVISGVDSPRELDLTIFHELTHNWFQGALASNERRAPWMDEGMTTYYENRYAGIKYPPQKNRGIMKLLGDPRFEGLMLRNQAAQKKDQPITTPSDSFTVQNYGMIAYTKSAHWMKKLEKDLGMSGFDRAMKKYYHDWKFRHPDRNDFQEVIETSSGKDLDSSFSLLDRKGTVNPEPRRPWKLVPIYQLEKTYDYKPVFIAPILTYNSFNGLMPGLVFHNFSLPLPRFNFAVAPFFGIRSGKFNGWTRLSYQWLPEEFVSNVELSVVAARMNLRHFTDSLNRKFSLAFQKLAPSLKIVFKEPYERSSFQKFLQFKFFMIGEDQLNFPSGSGDDYVTKARARYNVLQSRFVIENFRTLYPWKAELLAESHAAFYRLNFTGNYFFNFRKKGGVNLRLYAGKFFYTGDRDLSAEFRTRRFQLNMSGPKGFEDYTYSNPFIGRFDTEGFFNQQIMIRDGGFKVRTDLLADEAGLSDDWLSAVNLTLDVPDRFNILHALPVKIPLRLFADIGTYSEAWSSASGEPRFLFDGGFEIPLLNNLISFYFPVVYSDVYREYFKSTPGNKFFQRMSFSINIQDLSLRKITKQFSQ